MEIHTGDVGKREYNTNRGAKGLRKGVNLGVKVHGTMF
jgi:hypothetical protein